MLKLITTYLVSGDYYKTPCDINVIEVKIHHLLININ